MAHASVTELLLFFGMVGTVSLVAVIVLFDKGRSRRERWDLT